MEITGVISVSYVDNYYNTYNIIIITNNEKYWLHVQAKHSDH